VLRIFLILVFAAFAGMLLAFAPILLAVMLFIALLIYMVTEK